MDQRENVQIVLLILISDIRQIWPVFAPMCVVASYVHNNHKIWAAVSGTDTLSHAICRDVIKVETSL